MKKTKVVFVLLGLFLMAGCSANKYYHEYMMRGHVVSNVDGEIVVCVGSEDGAEVNDDLKVMRVVQIMDLAEGSELYEWDEVGTVKVVEIINEHFAKVRILSGDVEVHDTVQLKKKIE